LTAFAWAQGDSGEIRGTLSSARGGLAGIEVRVKNADTGEVKVTPGRGRYGGFCNSRQAKKSWSTSATKTTKRSTTWRIDGSV